MLVVWLHHGSVEKEPVGSDDGAPHPQADVLPLHVLCDSHASELVLHRLLCV